MILPLPLYVDIKFFSSEVFVQMSDKYILRQALYRPFQSSAAIEKMLFILPARFLYLPPLIENKNDAIKIGKQRYIPYTSILNNKIIKAFFTIFQWNF